MSRTVAIGVMVALTILSGTAAFGANLVLARLAAAPGPVPEAAEGAPVASTAPARATPAFSRALSEADYIRGIMQRNLFDVNVIASWVEKTDDPTEVPEADIKVKLLATMVASPEAFSSALIAEESSPDLPSAYSIGDMVHDRKVVSIEDQKVGLEKDGNVEYLLLEGGDFMVDAPAPGEEATTEGGEGGVTANGENKFTVSRDTFDKYINDLEGISRMGRALLHRGADGEFDGYRLSAIRRNTLADQLGIKNGDIIHSVNGQPLNSVQAAMGAYNTMRTEQSFCFEISRRGSPTELCYDVR